MLKRFLIKKNLIIICSASVIVIGGAIATWVHFSNKKVDTKENVYQASKIDSSKKSSSEKSKDSVIDSSTTSNNDNTKNSQSNENTSNNSSSKDSKTSDNSQNASTQIQNNDSNKQVGQSQQPQQPQQSQQKQQQQTSQPQVSQQTQQQSVQQPQTKPQPQATKPAQEAPKRPTEIDWTKTEQANKDGGFYDTYSGIYSPLGTEVKQSCINIFNGGTATKKLLDGMTLQGDPVQGRIYKYQGKSIDKVPHKSTFGWGAGMGAGSGMSDYYNIVQWDSSLNDYVFYYVGIKTN
jgi:hypothetical protein